MDDCLWHAEYLLLFSLLTAYSSFGVGALGLLLIRGAEYLFGLLPGRFGSGTESNTITSSSDKSSQEGLTEAPSTEKIFLSMCLKYPKIVVAPKMANKPLDINKIENGILFEAPHVEWDGDEFKGVSEKIEKMINRNFFIYSLERWNKEIILYIYWYFDIDIYWYCFDLKGLKTNFKPKENWVMGLWFRGIVRKTLTKYFLRAGWPNGLRSCMRS